MAPTVFFDLWNTLLYCPTRTKVDEILKRLQLTENLSFTDVMNEMDRKNFIKSEYSIETFMRELCEDNGVRCRDDAIADAVRIWQSRLDETKFFPETQEVLKDLREDYRLGLISNTDSTGAEYARKIRLDRYFDTIILSHEVGAVKPDLRIFRIALEASGAEAKNAWMVGDSVRIDVHGARDAGIKAILIDRNGNHSKVGCPIIKSLTELRNALK